MDGDAGQAAGNRDLWFVRLMLGKGIHSGAKLSCALPSQRSPNFLTPGTGFMEDNFSIDRKRGGRDGLGMIQVPYIWWLSWHIIFLQCRRPGFNAWVGKMPWRREWQPTPVFLPGKSHRQRSLMGYSPWGHKELDTMSDFHSLTYFYYYDISSTSDH